MTTAPEGSRITQPPEVYTSEFRAIGPIPHEVVNIIAGKSIKRMRTEGSPSPAEPIPEHLSILAAEKRRRRIVYYEDVGSSPPVEKDIYIG